MATVRFSASLRDQITNNAREMFSAEGERIVNSFNKQLLDGMYDRLFSSYIQHINALPTEFFKTVRALDIHVHRGASAIKYTLDRERPVPTQNLEVPGYFRISAHYSLPDVYLDSECPDWQALRDEYEAWRLRRVEHSQKVNDYVTMVDKIITAHATLAPALKVWPALWELIPPDVKERHKEVRESRRNKIKEELEDVDFGKLTAAVTVNKLRGQ